MYPAQLKIPEQKLITLTTVKDISTEYRFDATGHCINDMICDPFGHPAFAVSDGKTGSLLLYDAEEGQKLRAVGAGYHSVTSASVDSEYNFVLAENHGKEMYINIYCLKGEKISSFEVTEVEKVYCISCMENGKVAATVSTSHHEQSLRVYTRTGSIVYSLSGKDSNNKPIFIKPAHFATHGSYVFVADVMKKCVSCYSIESTDSEPLWTYSMEMPRGMCVDGSGNVCVCDFRNNRITLLSAQGKLIGQAPTGLSKPQFVILNNNVMYTVDMGRSMSYRVTGFRLNKSIRKSGKAKPDWQSQ